MKNILEFEFLSAYNEPVLKLPGIDAFGVEDRSIPFQNADASCPGAVKVSHRMHTNITKTLKPEQFLSRTNTCLEICLHPNYWLSTDDFRFQSSQSKKWTIHDKKINHKLMALQNHIVITQLFTNYILSHCNQDYRTQLHRWLSA